MTSLKHPRYPDPGTLDDPVWFDAKELATAEWADDKKFTKNNKKEYADRITFHYSESGDRIGDICIKAWEVTDMKYIYLNPKSKTGYIGRGILGKYGPNQAADPIVTRRKPSNPNVIQVVLITRQDNNQLALPGGFVDQGETVSEAVKREFEEEALNTTNEQVKSELNLLWKDGRIIFRGVVDDLRNTDWAWIETTVFHFHCSDFLGRNIHLEAGDDAKEGSAKWYDITPELISKMYASHGDYLRIVNDSFVKKWSIYDYFANSIIAILIIIIAILLSYC